MDADTLEAVCDFLAGQLARGGHPVLNADGHVMCDKAWWIATATDYVTREDR